ncbi:aminotransferase class-III [Acidimicrobium ferrooxidans DSM 10331]|uniref:(S)-3-amino-2-methylpropionate transaminase n=1 Tax=Acidimicrobium ferrooxidans (strain DSM 10331 / JCM 15462 / NBRC 103882 / ICP) TaxID=525909 RepID=C7LY42_ACIFD|nr:aminotransferase class III-fold pyridoxal phosphate-dependent enzyme [Acidimicrobium ferrooxidans]ACU53650.1 aminotransferase class-III [Acidimicrobium ferrooxidans DSM 10331]
MGRLAPVWSKVSPITVTHGRGARVWDTNGQAWLDMTAGIAVTSTGHAHPKVAEAIARQAERFIHAQVNIYTHDLLQPLADALDAITPDGIDTFFFSNSGAEATEAAVKLARQATKRPNVIVFQGSFHGRTAQAMAMTTSRTGYRAGYMPLPAGVFVSLFPGFPRSSRVGDEVSVDEALDYLDYLLASQTAPAETAAVVIEPVLGEGGYIPAPAAFLTGVVERARAHGIVFVADEVQTGFGRTGRMFAVEHANVTPDILVMAKGIASGFPFSGIGASWELMERWPVGSHGGTYGGNPMGVAAALATIQVIQEEGLVDNAARRGAQLQASMERIAEKFECVSRVRGLGLMVGVELRDDAGRPDADLVGRVLAEMQASHRVLAMSAGTFGNIIRWMPPLVVSEAEIDEAAAAFEASLAHVLAQR